MEKRTYYCGKVRAEHIEQIVNLYGWVHSRRDHGGVIFIDLRDREGLVQIVFQPDKKELFNKAEKLKPEYVLGIKGNVRRRPEGTVNPKLPTGEVEVVAENLEILNTSEVPAFEISDFSDVSEEIRLKYRYLDLRRTNLKENLVLRHNIAQSIRKYLTGQGFIEIETPFLTKSTPEGARDFLVPSRLFPGSFYALPQSPQLFKQILMVSGFDKYFQIVRCFRDEDLRADRQPEFTQVDLEMSFIDENDIITLIENMLTNVLKDTMNIDIKVPFSRMSYQQSLDEYGSDRPDTRFDMKLTNVTEIVESSRFKVFSETVKSGGQVKSICLKDGAKISNTEINRLAEFAIEQGAKGLAWLKVIDTGPLPELESPIKKFFTDEELKKIVEKTKSVPNDIIFFVADKINVANNVLGTLRLHLAEKFDIIKDKKTMEFIWITDFPLFEWSETEKRWVSMHHPFTMPREQDLGLIDKFPECSVPDITGRAYDLVLNGVELGGGSIRIHKMDLQNRIFKILKIDEKETKERFGFLLSALTYGAPPHGGIALGFDRFIAILTGEDSIREVIAFPKTQKGICPLTNAPDVVSLKQLKELDIEIKLPQRDK